MCFPSVHVDHVHRQVQPRCHQLTVLVLCHAAHDFDHPVCLATFERIDHAPEWPFVAADEFLLPIQLGRHEHT